MGIKNNFEKALKKAISKDPMGYKAILDEDHDCEKIHPEMTHEEWSKTKEKENEITQPQLKKPFNICMVNIAIKELRDDNIHSIELTQGGGVHIRWNDN